MTPDLYSELLQLRKDARKKLREVADPRNHHRLFTFFIEPSFYPSESITLYASGLTEEESEGIVSQTIWRSDLDGEKFRDPVERLRHGRHLEPTFERTTWEIDAPTVKSIRERLMKIVVPVFPSSPLGIVLDGTNYELNAETFTLKWWEDGPTEWQPLREAAMDIVKILKSAHLASPLP